MGGKGTRAIVINCTSMESCLRLPSAAIGAGQDLRHPRLIPRSSTEKCRWLHILQTHVPCVPRLHIVQAHVPCVPRLHIVQTHAPCVPRQPRKEVDDGVPRPSDQWWPRWASVPSPSPGCDVAYTEIASAYRLTELTSLWPSGVSWCLCYETGDRGFAPG